MNHNAFSIAETLPKPIACLLHSEMKGSTGTDNQCLPAHEQQDKLIIILSLLLFCMLYF